MALSSEAQSLFDHARNSLPRWLTGATSAALEWLYGFTEIFDEIRAQGQDWLDITYITKASGAELDQHAADRGTTRRAGEDNVSLRARLRQIEDAVSYPAVLRGIDLILDVNHQAYLQVNEYVSTGWNTLFYVSDSIYSGGSGPLTRLEVIADGGFTPTVEVITDNNVLSNGSGYLVRLHFFPGSCTRTQAETLIASTNMLYVGASSSLPSSNLTSNDAFGATAHLAGIVALRHDRGHFHNVGQSKAFFNRGYRMARGGRPMAYVVILPYNTSVAEASAVREYIRQHGPAGYLTYIEIRTNSSLT